MRWAPFLVAVLLWIPTFTVEVAAETVARGATGYSVAGWVDRDGLPPGPVWAIAQDDAGFLWLGTSAGLVRFDGVRFDGASSLGYSDVPVATVRALHISKKDGRLWIGYANGAGVRTLAPGQQSGVANPGGIAGFVNAFTEDANGTVWAATTEGLYSFMGSAWVRATLPWKSSEPIHTVYADRSGGIWVGSELGLLHRPVNDVFRPVQGVAPRVYGVTEDRNGHVWTTDQFFGFRRLNTVTPDHYRQQGAGRAVFDDGDGNLWVATIGQGLWRVRQDFSDGGLETSTVETGLVDDDVTMMLQDRDANLWVGTRQGLNRLTPHTVTSIVGVGLYRTLGAAVQGGIWLGTVDGLSRLPGVDGGEVDRRETSRVTALLHAADGVLWFGTAKGLLSVAPGAVHAVAVPAGRTLTQISSLATAGDGSLLVLDRGSGLLRWDGRNLTRVHVPAGVPADRVTFVYSDHSGRTWVAFQDGQLGVIEGRRALRLLGASDGLAEGAHGTVAAVLDDGRGAVWIAGSRGLTKYADGKFVTVDRAHGLPGDSAMGVAVDEFGYLWVVLDFRLVRFHSDEFATAARQPGYRLRYRQFGAPDGLSAVYPRAGNAGTVRSVDGRLWFVTGRGLAIIDPRTIQARQNSPTVPVQIDRAIVNDEQTMLPAARVLPSQTRRVRVDFTAPTIATPGAVRFRYRLEGFDSSWVDAGTRRQALYTNLPPREYRFVVQAERNDSTAAAVSTSWTFRVQPAFYQTWWFYTAISALCSLIAWRGWQYRALQVRRELSLVVAERARVSREIHDTLLQDLAAVAVQCAGVSNTLDPASPATAHLVAIRQQVQTCLREARQAIWNLRAPVLETHSLGLALREFGQQLARQSDVRFDLTVRGKVQRCPAHVENGILRIGQEALTNAMRHAHASRVSVDLVFNRETLSLRVADDGRGFDPTSDARQAGGHMGLLSIRERASDLHGQFALRPRHGGGTDLQVIVPLADLASSS